MLEQVRLVLAFFPELGGLEIRVGLTRAAHGYASMESLEVWMNPYRLTLQTITHELVHLVQARGLLPGGEKTADLYALARHPALVDDLPGYLKVPEGFVLEWAKGVRARPAGLLHRTARESLALTDTPRRAIRRFESMLAARWDAGDRAAPAPIRSGAPQLPLFGEDPPPVLRS